MNSMLEEHAKLTGSTRRLLREFEALSIPCGIIDGTLNLIYYQTKDGVRKTLKGLVSEDLPLFSKLICDDKWWTHRLFQDLSIPMPATTLYSDDSHAADFLVLHQNLVVKPRSGAHGHGVQLNISEPAMIGPAVAKARAYDTDIILQKQLEGRDIRILVIGGQIISALERRPASVTGDGVRSVQQLIDKENERQDRGIAGVDALIKISPAAVKNHLSVAELAKVLLDGQELRVVGPANHSMGGTVHNALPLLTDDIRAQTLQITNHLRMPIAGVDCLLTPTGHYFLEINASPGIGIHDDNFAGVTTGCFKIYADLLYQNQN